MLKNFKQLYKDVLKISKLSNVGNKKLRIFISIILSNITVGFDLLIIVVFSRILGEEITSDNKIITYVLDNLYLLPLIIVLRFISIYVEKTNIQLLVLQIMENLKDYIIKEVYKKRKLFNCRCELLLNDPFRTYLNILWKPSTGYKQLDTAGGLFNFLDIFRPKDT